MFKVDLELDGLRYFFVCNGLLYKDINITIKMQCVFMNVILIS
ncbi:MAG: hypothetical protein OFPII_06450 [Osedax symbiont Rs1]|nr:MAG: hypothetical protein OFPII_06450 [Osedax symbiont Rs1]